MKKSNAVSIALVCSLCVIVGLSSAIYLFGFPRFDRCVSVTFSELESDPQSWLGKRVCVSGTLRCYLAHIPEAVAPYNCVLYSFDMSKHVAVRILDVYTEYDDRNMTVIGVFREGETGPLIIRTVYYVEAEIVLPIA